MASLQKIKHRITSINSTKKIIKAMELISTAKFGKIKHDYDQVNSYYKTVERVFINLIRHSNQDIDKLLNKNPWKFESKRNLYIVFGSDLGLCGAYNTEMIKKINEVVNDEDIMIVIGSKLLSFLQKRPNTHIIQTLTQIGDTPSYDVAEVIAKKIYDVLQISDLLSVKLIYTQYVNAILAEPVVKSIFPIDEDTIQEFAAEEIEQTVEFQKVDASSYEPNAHVILENSFIIFFEASIYYALFNAKLSEMSSRRTAMESANNNAKDLIEDLELQYNRTRQAKITQEITEIVSGANS